MRLIPASRVRIPPSPPARFRRLRAGLPKPAEPPVLRVFLWPIGFALIASSGEPGIKAGARARTGGGPCRACDPARWGCSSLIIRNGMYNYLSSNPGASTTARPAGAVSIARSRSLCCASDLFYRKGITHVGVNEIIEASGVARMTLYHHIKSKNDTISAVLDQRRERRLEGIRAAMQEAGTPRGRILAVFDYLDRIAGDPGFRGCAFINAAVELADPAHPGFALALRHKRRMIEEFERIA